METHRICATVASLLTLAAAQADVYMGLAANKRHYQTSALKLRFDQGELNLLLRDGLVILDGACVIDPQLFFFGPSDIPPCPLGATGFIAQGDVDRDGVRDDNQYWSVQSVIPAFVIEPSRQDLCQLYSGPPSKLPRPLQNFRDDAVVTFYDISTAVVRQYDQTRYELSRPYGSVRQVETAVAAGEIFVTGLIDVVITGQDIVGSPLVVPVNAVIADDPAVWADTARITLSAIPAITNVYTVGGTGANIVLTEITPNGNDPTLNIALLPGTSGGPGLPAPISIDTAVGTLVGSPAAALKQMKEELIPGQYVFTFPRLNAPDLNPVAIPVTIVPNLEAVDPAARSRAGFRFTSGLWDGDFYQMDPRIINTITWQGNDQTVIRPGDQFYFSILNPAEDFITFPPTVPQNPVLLSTPTVQEYTMPPFFYEVGEEGVVNLRYQRIFASNGVAFDVSQRVFRAKTRMVDSYAGYAQITLPLGSPTTDLVQTGNIDRDSMTNIEEFAYQYPTNEHINASASEQFVPVVLANPLLIEQFSRVVNKVPEPIINAAAQPAGLTGPFLDIDNHVVLEVPFRPRTGTTLRYDFVETSINSKGKIKTKKLKIGNQWTTSFREVVTLQPVTIEVKILLAATGDVVAIQQRAAPPVSITQQILVLRSTNPVANPADPLPNLGVKLTAVTPQ